MAYVPEQGDIIWLDFDPSAGKEIMKRRPAFVLSKRLFNEHTKMALVIPITSTIRNVKLEVILSQSVKTQGAILVAQLRSVDFLQRKAKFIERVPDEIVMQVYSIAHALIRVG